MKEPTMEEVLELVAFGRGSGGDLYVAQVYGDIKGSVGGSIGGSVRGFVHGDVDRTVGGTVGGDILGDVLGNVKGSIGGIVHGDVKGCVWGTVKGTINSRDWRLVETPKEKTIRLIREGRGEEAIDVLEISGVCGD